jgi:hypothetical protein
LAWVFEDPIELPNGRKLTTLHDAAQYIFALPKRTVEQAKRQLAMLCLIDAADRDGIRMPAHAA